MDFTETGQIGDTIGGIMGPFVAIMASYLTFIAFWVQFQANKLQREDIAKERFNTNFYHLLSIHEQVTDGLELDYSKLAMDKEQGIHRKKIVESGRHIFRTAFEDMLEQIEGKKTFRGMRNLLFDRGLDAYELSQTPTYFDHYFRMMYRIVKMIDESSFLSEKEKYDYVAILRSKLSRYELVWLFYNSLSSYGYDKFKPLVEKYAMLNNLRCELLVREEVKLYEASAFGD